MHLELTADQLELRDSARSVLARECPPRLVRDVVLAGIGATQLGKTLAWLGWTALPIAPDQGGLGRGPVELAVVLEELGRAAAPGPFMATMTQFVPALRLAGTDPQVHRFLSSVAAGDATGTLAVHEHGTWATGGTSTAAVADGEGWVLTGRKRHILCGADVDEVIIPARCEHGRVALFVVPAADLTFHPRTSLDPTRPVVDVDLDGVWVPGTRMLGEPDVDATGTLARAVDEAIIGAALDAIGACDALVEAAAGAALTRRAAPEGVASTDGPPPGDGRHVASGAKQTLGAMVAELEAARAIAYQAVAALAADDPSLAITARYAAEATARAQHTVATGALELTATRRSRSGDGAEIDVELWVRRAHASALLLGTPTDHRLAITDHLVGDVLPASLHSLGDAVAS
jgi:alkylation response protein AidB-like acyl-CoA dehydrogenase